ncbi:MAG TPA: MltA domain-containing protein [Acetobacteraceae bacterium]|jgi:membrane-bound lytic murein transglycosylase A
MLSALRRAMRRLFAPAFETPSLASPRLATAGLAVLGLLAVAGCAQLPGAPGATSAGAGPAASWSVPSGPGPAFIPVSYKQLPGWNADHLSDAIPAFLAGCAVLDANPGAPLGGEGEAAALGGTARQWHAACDLARAVPPGDDIAARHFFEIAFQAYGVSTDGSATGLFTGYYEPEVAGSRVRTSVYKYPIYRRPPDLVGDGRTPYLTRVQIDRGALAHRHLELLWLADPVDVFFLQVQGAGRVRLRDGHVVRVTYDGKNGQPYVPIGRVLVDRGEMTMDEVSMQSIRAWLAAHPAQVTELLEQNPSFVFFREVHDATADAGAPGSLGAPLSPDRSLAVDKSFIPLGAPLWVDTKDTLDGTKLQRLMVAQDLGGAIRGPVRADIFFGWGPDAEAHAGKMRGQGMEFLLLPKGA